MVTNHHEIAHTLFEGDPKPEMPEETRAMVINYFELVFEKSPLGNLWRKIVPLHPHMMLGPTLRGLVDEAMAEGETMGEAKSIIKLITARGIALTPDERDRITSCLDRQVLDVWFSRALTASTAQEIFADEA